MSPDVAATVVRVELAERAYEIAIGPGVLASCGAALGSAGARRAVIIADTGVLATHADAVDASLRHAGIETMTIPVQRGEASKSVTEAARLWEAAQLTLVPALTGLEISAAEQLLEAVAWAGGSRHVVANTAVALAWLLEEPAEADAAWSVPGVRERLFAAAPAVA